ncbi:MAG: CDGSH iron-sulfur domain-containing protein [Actinomycetota bacterium]|nr:CDGSH iron-sulfur domain-containing protein [Actinomycetota bacterium]
MTVPAETPSEPVRPQVRVCPGGPLLVRGATSVTTEDGQVHAVRRPVVALCRCGLSRLTPFCDGTHKALRRS